MRKIALLVEGAEQNPVELLRRGEVVPEGLFDDDASAVGAARLGQLFHDEPEQRGRDGEVVRRPLRGAELFADGLKGCRVFVVAVDIAQQAAQLVESRGIDSRRVSRGCRAPAPGAGRDSNRPWPRR